MCLHRVGTAAGRVVWGSTSRVKKNGPQVIDRSPGRSPGVPSGPVGANHCFVMDLPFNPSVLDQACDRVYRVGQTRPVTVHYFLTSTRVEKWQRRLLVPTRVPSFVLFLPVGLADACLPSVGRMPSGS